jgi:hypothetical protein
LDRVHDLVTRIAAAYGVDRAKAYRILSKVRKESGHLDFQAENSAASPGEPPVDELLQVSTNDDGQTVVTRVRPITAALMGFVKRKLDLPDTIDISPDEMHATWIEEFSVHAADSSPGDDDRTLLVKIETFEDRNLLTLTVLIDEVSLLGKDKALLERLVAKANGSLPQGCYHLLDGTGETAEHDDGHTGSQGSKISNMCRVLFDAALPSEQNTADTLGGQPAPVIKPEMIATLFEAGLAAANAMRDQLRRSGWSRENHSDESPGMLIERAEFRAVVAAAKAIANARQDETLTPGLLLAGVLRASQVAGPERAAIRAALGVDGLGQAFDSLRTLSIDPSNASEPAKDAKMPLSAELQKLLKDHKRSGLAEFIAQLLEAGQR